MFHNVRMVYKNERLFSARSFEVNIDIEPGTLDNDQSTKFINQNLGEMIRRKNFGNDQLRGDESRCRRNASTHSGSEVYTAKRECARKDLIGA